MSNTYPKDSSLLFPLIWIYRQTNRHWLIDCCHTESKNTNLLHHFIWTNTYYESNIRVIAYCAKVSSSSMGRIHRNRSISSTSCHKYNSPSIVQISPNLLLRSIGINGKIWILPTPRTIACNTSLRSMLNRGSTFWLYVFLNDAAPWPKFVGNRPFCFAWFSFVYLGHGIIHPAS